MTKLPRLGLATIALAATCSACTVSAPLVPLAPPGVHVRGDVADGFRAYEERLVAWGTWAPDTESGVRWCPSAGALGGAPGRFQPYASRGHWDLAHAPIGAAPTGSPVWRSDDADTWGEITTQHGYWIRVPASRGGPWCWVPGVEETAARVLWREGDGFVGWAPEPPLWVACDDVDYEDGLDWVFTLLGSLLEGAIDQNALGGDAERRARAATAPERKASGFYPRTAIGPSARSIQAARVVLARFAAVHPDALAAAAAAAAPSDKSSTKSSGSSSGSDSSSGSKKKDDAAVAVGFVALPYAPLFYDALLMQPPPPLASTLPRASVAVASSDLRTSGAASAAFLPGSRARSEAGLRAGSATSVTQAFAAPAYGAVSARHPSSSYSYSSSSSSRGGGSSHSSSSSSHGHGSRR